MRHPASSFQLQTHFHKIILALVLVVTTGPCHAEARLKAYVVRNKVKGSPVAQVSFSADGQHAVSLSDGSFELLFAQRNPGEVVRLVMKLAGWEVLNNYVLDHTLLNRSESRALEIIIVKEEEYEQKALSFYQLKGERAVEQEVSRARAKVLRTNMAPAEALKRLESERDQARKQVVEFARLMAQAKPGETGQVYNQALKLFLDGKPDQALELLNEARLQKDADSAMEKSKQSAKEWQLRAQILVTKFDFAGASRAYKQATELLPGEAEPWFQYGLFHQNQNKLSEARLGYEHALSLYRFNADQGQIAMVQNNLGKLHSEENRKVEARLAYDEALQIYRQLAQVNPNVYLSEVAIALNNLGVLYAHENHKVEAHAAYGEALEIFRKIATKKPDDYQQLIAGCLNNLGNLYKEERRMTEARAAYEEALSIRRQLANKNPIVYKPYVAHSLSNLAVLHAEEDRMEEARTAYEKSLQIYRDLAADNPDVYRFNVAMALNNLGIVHTDQERNAEARVAYDEALSITRLLAVQNSDVYEPNMAMILNNLGIMYSNENRKEEARKAFGEALGIYKKFVLKSETYRDLFNKVLNELDSLEK